MVEQSNNTLHLFRINSIFLVLIKTKARENPKLNTDPPLSLAYGICKHILLVFVIHKLDYLPQN